MRTQFFKDMVSDDGREMMCYLRPLPRVLYIEQVLGREEAEWVSRDAFPDDQNPYLHPEVYRAMLRDQYMVRARLMADVRIASHAGS